MAHNTSALAPRTQGPPPFVTSALSFAPLVEQEPFGPPHVTNHYQNITFSQPCWNYSQEELRVNDYAHGVAVSTQKTAVPFNVVAGNRLTSTQRIVSAFGSFKVGVFSSPGENPRLRLHVQQGKSYGTKIVTIRVGKESASQDFMVHENLMVARSPFVRTALNNDWKEAKSRVIPMPEDQPETFSTYQQWLYSGKLFSRHDEGTIEDAAEYELLVKAYILGEKLMDSRFQDTILDCIVQKLRKTSTFDIGLSNLVYENTPSNSPLRRLWCDVYAWSGSPSWLDESKLSECVHAEFLMDLSRLQMSFWGGERPKQIPYAGNTCDYHHHRDGVCYVWLGS